MYFIITFSDLRYPVHKFNLQAEGILLLINAGLSQIT